MIDTTVIDNKNDETGLMSIRSYLQMKFYWRKLYLSIFSFILWSYNNQRVS